MDNSHRFFWLFTLLLLWWSPVQAQVSSVPSVGSDILQWRCDDAAGSGTTYMNASAGNNAVCTSTDTEVAGQIRHTLPRAGKVIGSHCDALSAPGAGNSWTMKLQVNGTPSEATTCVISGASAVTCDFIPQVPLTTNAKEGVTVAIVEAGVGVDGGTIKCSALYNY